MSILLNAVRRRAVLGAIAGLTAAPGRGLAQVLAHAQAPALIAADAARPQPRWGLQTGDVEAERAMVWARSDRPSRLWLEWSTAADMRSAQRICGPSTLDIDDFIARHDLRGLPPGADIHLRLQFESLADGSLSAPLIGRLRTPARRAADIRFVWGGDTVGQGWGIDLASGGMQSYARMRECNPDFFVHCGDTIYADGPLQPVVALPDGQRWTNAFLDEVPEKTQVAQTLQQFRRHYLYNHYDEQLRRFNAEVPQIWAWDDHEVVNNWSPGKDLTGDPRYAQARIGVLAANAARAFLDYAPLRRSGADGARIYRRIDRGPLLDLFVLDMRSYRGANSANRQAEAGSATRFLGLAQLEWLKRELARSSACWKVIVADMPIGLQIGDGQDAQGLPRWEAIANGDGGAPLGRELEIAELLRFIKAQGIVNTVWLTADVHYCAAHHYAPERAAFKDFLPFWEFVAGPLHAGSFGPNALDASFGPEVVFQRAPDAGQANLPPSADLQFFGQVDIEAATRVMTVSLIDRRGRRLFSQRIEDRRPAA